MRRRPGAYAWVAPRALVAAGMAVSAAPVASGDGHAAAAVRGPEPDPVLTGNALLAEALPDECFVEPSIDYPPIDPDGTCEEGTPKTNESYVWSLTQAGSRLWFGTMAAGSCAG